MKFDNLPKKISSLIEPIPFTDCWVWTGSYSNNKTPFARGEDGKNTTIGRMIMGVSSGRVYCYCGHYGCLNHLTHSPPYRGYVPKKKTTRRKERGLYYKGPVRRDHGGIICHWTKREWATIVALKEKKSEDRYLASRTFGRMKRG